MFYNLEDLKTALMVGNNPCDILIIKTGDCILSLGWLLHSFLHLISSLKNLHISRTSPDEQLRVPVLMFVFYDFCVKIKNISDLFRTKFF